MSLNFEIAGTPVEVGSTEWANAVAVGEVSYQYQLKVHGLEHRVPISAPSSVHVTSSTSSSGASVHISTAASSTTSTSSSSSSELGHFSIHSNDFCANTGDNEHPVVTC